MPVQAAAREPLAHERSTLEAFGFQLLAGGGAGAISKTCVAPAERVKVIAQVDATGRTPFVIARAIINEQGVPAFWRGNGVNVVRIIPNAAIKFSCNDAYKRLLTPEGGDPRNLPVAQKLLAGSSSGVTMTMLTYPLDVARTRVTADMAGSNGQRQFHGLVDCLTKTARAEGAGGLFKGLGPSVASIIPYVGIGFTLYDELKILAAMLGSGEGGGGDPSMAVRLLCGAGSGVGAQTFTYPIDTVRRRIQVDGQLGQPKIYTGAVDCAVKLFGQGGIRAFYRGLAINAAKTAPGAAIQFCAYDFLKEHFSA